MSKKLGYVLNSVRDLELAQLSAITENQFAMENEIEAFRIAMTDIQERAFDPDRLATSEVLNANTRWRQWAETWIGAKHAELVTIAAEREQQKFRAQVAFARAAAFDALLAKQKKRSTPK